VIFAKLPMPPIRTTLPKTMAMATLLLVAVSLFAEDEPRVMLEASLEPPVVGSTWVLTVLADHDNPNQVSVMEPPLADGLFLEQILQGPRLVNLGSWLTGVPHGATYERWTATEYRFVLNTYGTFNFGPFTVITPQGQARTRPFTLEVQPPQLAAGARHYGTTWEGMPQSLGTGESVVFTLKLGDGTYQEPMPTVVPRAGLFMPTVPPGHILESLPITQAEASQGTVLRLRLIPLEAGAFFLAHRRFSYGNAVFEIPTVHIPVSQSATGLVIAAPSAETVVPVIAGPAPPFPSHENALAANPRLRQRYRAEFEAAYFTALNLWERGYRANALAVLRQNERDHSAGALFAEVRREAEAALGITGTHDERRRGFVRGIPFFRERTNSAVLRETAVRRVPDPAGEEIARFTEGQPVTIGRENGQWVLVTAGDANGTSGWIPGENIILY